LAAPTKPDIGGMSVDEVLDMWMPDDLESAPPNFPKDMEPLKYEDCVHGPCVLEPEIVYLLRLPMIRRLRDVKQLSFVYLTNIGAMHSRLEHMRGACIVAQKFAEHLRLDPDIKKALCIAAFLHDASHGPFGHSLEQIGELLVGDDIKRHGKLDKSTLERYITEKSQQLHIALESIPDLNLDLLQKVLLPGYWAKLEADYPHHSYLLDLISSDIDVDRIDYVARDSHHVSPPFSHQFDWKGCAHRFVEMSSIVEFPPMSDRWCLGFNSEIQGDIQNFLVYRRKLYEELYLSAPKISIDTMISHAVYYCINELGLVGRPVVRRMLKFTDNELKLFLKIVGPRRASAIADSIEKERYYEPIYSDSLPSTNSRFQEFTATIQGSTGFVGRVKAEDRLTENLPSSIRKLAGDLPPVIFSLPSPYRPTDENKQKLLELEPSREALIFKESGRPKLLGEVWEPYLENVSLLYSFHILVPRELTSEKKIIREKFRELMAHHALL
jgi:hypothetical protein